MRCINAGGIPEAVGIVALILLVLLLPRGLATNDDVILADSDDCGDPNERGWQSDRTAQGRGCQGSSHQPTDANRDANESAGGAPRPSRQQLIDRKRRKETWRNVLIQRFWNARRNRSGIGIQVLRRPMHATDLQEFKALLEKTEPSREGRSDEQDPVSRNRVYLPQCSGPQNFTGHWNDGTNFRLYFNLEPITESSGHRPGRDPRVLSAFIHLKRKITPTPSTPSATRNSSRIGRHAPGEGARMGGQRVALRKRRPSNASDVESEQLKVIVYMYSRPTKKLRQEPKSVIRTVLFSRYSPGWLRINLTPTADDWVKRPHRNFGIQVTVLNEGGTEELHPGDYFEGLNCTEDSSQPIPEELPLWTVEETFGHLSINDTVVDVDMNLTQPYLEIITTEPARSRSRHQRDLGAVHSERPAAIVPMQKSRLRPTRR